MNHVASAAKGAASMASDHVKQAVSHVTDHVHHISGHVQEQGYFEPICTERHLSVRHYTWDAFKYVGDVSHLLALALCIGVVLRENGTEGVSFKTHLLFLIVFTCRFSNVFFCEQSIYLVLYKVLLWTGTLKIVIFMWALGSRNDHRDTLPLAVVVLPTFVFALVFGVYSMQDHGLIIELLWIFSIYLESVAMLPQYIYCYRDSENTCPLVSSYVLTMGGYRMVFGLSWLYHYLVMPYYLDVSSLVSGILGIVFFCDYLLFKLAKLSRAGSTSTKELQNLIGTRNFRGEAILLEQPSTPRGVTPEKFGKSFAEVELSTDVVIYHRVCA